jgi:hypothetical protein
MRLIGRLTASRLCRSCDKLGASLPKYHAIGDPAHWKDPMSTLLISAATLLVISFTARAATYTISSYPAGLADLPCDAFKKNADGSWTQVATLIAGGALIPAGNNFKNTAETRIIERNCDKK